MQYSGTTVLRSRQHICPEAYKASLFDSTSVISIFHRRFWLVVFAPLVSLGPGEFFSIVQGFELKKSLVVEAASQKEVDNHQNVFWELVLYLYTACYWAVVRVNL